MIGQLQGALLSTRPCVADCPENFYGNLEWRFRRWRWPISVRPGERQHRRHPSRTAPQPSTFIRWLADPARGCVPRLSLADAFESRGDERLVPDVSPFFARNLPRRARNTFRAHRCGGIGLPGEFAALRTTVDLRLFHERIPNRILAAPRVCSPPIANSIDRFGLPGRVRPCRLRGERESVTLRGIEYQVRWQPFERTRIMLNQAFIDIGQHFRAFETSSQRFQPRAGCRPQLAVVPFALDKPPVDAGTSGRL